MSLPATPVISIISLSTRMNPPVTKPVASATVSVTSPAAYVPPSSIVVVVADADHATDKRPAGIAAGVVLSAPRVTVRTLVVVLIPEASIEIISSVLSELAGSPIVRYIPSARPVFLSTLTEVALLATSATSINAEVPPACTPRLDAVRPEVAPVIVSPSTGVPVRESAAKLSWMISATFV